MSEIKKAFLPVGAGAVLIWWLVREGVTRAGMMPVAASREAVIVDHAFSGMLSITVPIFAVVVATLFYSILRFRSASGRGEGIRIYGSKGNIIEIIWVALSTVLTMGLAAYGAQEFLALRGDDNADLTVQVKAAQWSWEFYYPEQDTVSTDLLLPVNKRIRILLSSEDVVHSFWIPEFRVKQDAVPGRVIHLLVTPTREGVYDLVCAELCGLDHTLMRGKVKVLSEEEFNESLEGEAW